MDFEFERPRENKVNNKLIVLCDKTIHLIVYLLVFLTPLFFLTDTVDFFDYNKQYLIWAAVAASLIIWMSKMVLLEKKVTWKRTPLDIPICIFLGANFLTAIFSIDRYLSFWGTYGIFYESLMNIFAMAILYFIITNNF
ncbi:MAG: hypothetical protein V1860_03955 [bacterium]